MPEAAPALPPFERYRLLLDDWPAFAAAACSPLPTCVWTNTLRLSPGRLADWLRREGFEAQPLTWYPGAFRLPPDANAGACLPYRAGLYHIQEEVSLLPVPLLAPLPGERVLDLCAAPGNKTAQIAVAMRNRGTLVANDRSAGRLGVLRTTLIRLGLANVSTTQHDAARFPIPRTLFDRVLADVPCSCEGTSRKHPRVVQQAGPAQSRKLQRTQQAILKRAVQLCRPGGRIVYATCTYAPEENEAVVNAVLQAAPGLLHLRSARLDGLAGSPGLTEYEGQVFHPDLRHALRIWPHQNDTGGFFVAVLDKGDAG